MSEKNKQINSIQTFGESTKTIWGLFPIPGGNNREKRQISQKCIGLKKIEW